MVAPLLGPLLGGVLGAVTNNVVALAIKLAGKDLWSNSDNDIRSIKRELGLIARAEEEQLTEELRDLALEFEDLLDRALRHVVKQHKDPLYKVLGFADAVQLKQKVKDLEKRLKDAYQRMKSDHQVITTVNTYTTKVGPVGIGESKREIWEWVMKDVEDGPEQRRVMSVVGFSGSGKSTLVKEVFDCPKVASKFPHRACVVASAHNGDAKMILMELFQKLGQGEKISNSDDVEQLQAKISDYLKKSMTKSQSARYLIVLDDIKNQMWWDGIKSAFPEKATGRIIVTTTIQRVAKVCSRGNGYVHNMEALDDKHSKELLQAVLKGHSTQLERSSMSIRNKCDGHPHALVTVANYLQGEDSITESVCDQLCNNLGFHMATEDAFVELQKVLINHYKSLPKGFPNLKTCLLYVCVFPNGCNISRSRLIRRWCAEGYVQYDFPRSPLVVAEENFKKLVNQSIIWPIDTSKDANVKTCRAHGIFHEFMLHMSKSAKFITSYEDPDRRNYRHLFIQNKSRGMASNVNNRASPEEPGGKSGEEEEPRAHSLTLCGKSRVAVGYIAKCALLRVLDVEECEDLMDGDLDGIHELYHLKYLSVGHNITRPPNDIEKMNCLETLDMRKTKQEIALPVEVIQLPNLAHLLGKFKLDNKKWDKSKPENYVPEKSNLQTLAGFVTHHEGFQLLMDHMKQLRKVKICASWVNSTGEDPDLESAIQKFVQAEQDTGLASRRSLSLDFRNSYGNILRSLAWGCLRSLKLHGELKGLVHFVKLLCSLKELCLSSTNDLTEVDRSDLRELSCLDLEYLKLVGVSLGGFVIGYMDFRGLLHLCLVQCPSLPTVEEGALPNLLSLGLLNQELDGLSGFKIECHEFLQEIALDSEVKPETKSEWKNAAKNHQKRPRVLYLKRVSPDATGSMVKYVATEKPLLGASSSIVLGKRPMVEQSNSFDRHSFKQVRVADPSPASAELFSAMEIDMMPSSSRVFQTLADDSISHRVKHQVSESI